MYFSLGIFAWLSARLVTPLVKQWSYLSLALSMLSHWNIFFFQGFRGFYKGMATPLVGVAPIFAVSFAGFNVGKQIQQNKPDDLLS